MNSLTITLPQSLREFVKQQAKEEGHRSAGDYVKSLVKEAEKAKLRAAIDKKLLEAIASLDRGEGREITPEDWEKKRERIRQRMRKRK